VPVVSAAASCRTRRCEGPGEDAGRLSVLYFSGHFSVAWAVEHGFVSLFPVVESF